MNKPTHLKKSGAQSLAIALASSLFVGCATTAVTDGQVNANNKGYEAQQGAIKTLNDSGQHRVSSYSLSKAQCWLDVSYHEFSRNDRSKFVPEALQESQKITDFLAEGFDPEHLDNPAHATPLVNDAALLRQDLWDTAANLKLQPGYSCAAQQVSCAEVELVHAGNEYNQQGWRHAKPYVQIAEDLIGRAAEASDNCVAGTPPSKPVSLLVNVLFNFDKYAIDETHPTSMQRLASIVGQINTGQYHVTGLELTGHADRSNKTGDPNYNVLLSQRRAKTVLSYLSSEGIDVSNTPITYRGDSVQVSTCEEKTYSRTELHECLLPNRRVEVRLKLQPK